MSDSMKTWAFIAFIVSSIVLATVLGASDISKIDRNKPAVDYGDRLISVEDKERGVVCYRMRSYDGIACIKLETKGPNK